MKLRSLPSPLVSLADFKAYVQSLNLSDEEADSLRKTELWILDFLCKPYNQLGRKGDVCPYTKIAIRKDRLKLALISVKEYNVSSFASYLLLYLECLIQMQESERNIYNTLILALTNIRLNEIKEFIDETHTLLKPKFVSKGYMIGQFYPGCDVRGIHNKNFLSLHAPHPLFVIRNMVEQDIFFLDDSENYLNSYHSYFNKVKK